MVGLLLSTLAIVSSHAQTYNIDPTHTNVRFAIDHFNTSTNTGGFYNITGQLEYDPTTKMGDISLVIPLNSLNTGNEAFDIALKSVDFFDIEKFPLAEFNSTKWHFSTDKKGSDITKVEGMLTLHGKTNPITLTATKFNCYFSPILKKSVCGGDFTTIIDRRKWGISKYTLLGMTEKVQLDIQIEAAKQ
tara:strand:+ start:540 stop:1106 length:567 start_codon:yes stop_codon:yes gene_type:complete